MSYTDVFGGDAVHAVPNSYAYYAITAALYLQWPYTQTSGANVTADIIDITASPAGLPVVMPDATLVSVGEDVVINNIGGSAFTVQGNDGHTIISIPPGQSWLIYLTDNSTVGGTWRAVVMGASSSAANAAALAGYGLVARGAQLDQNLVTVTSAASTLSIGAGQKAEVIKNTGGSVTWNIDSAITLGNGWFFYALNAGTGSITIDPFGAQTIDGQATKTLSLGQSCIVVSDGANLATMALSTGSANAVSAQNIDITGTGDYTLTGTQPQAQIQDFSGGLSGNRNVIYPAAPGYWFVWNHTTGAFSTTFKLNTTTPADPGVIVPQNSFAILRSNGSNLTLAYSGALAGTVTSVAAGTGLTTDQSAGGAITGAGTIRIADINPSTPIGGAYGTGPDGTGAGAAYPLITVNNQGQISVKPTVANLGQAAFRNTSPSSGAGLVPLVDATTGMLQPANGGPSTGDVKANISSTAIPGWVRANGTRVGNTGSNADGRANADTQNLFNLLWANSGAGGSTIWLWNGSTLAASTRGATALADWNAGKVMAVPDFRGCAMVGVDESSGRLTAAGFGNANINTPAALGGGPTTSGQAVNVTSVSTSGTLTGNASGTAFISVTSDPFPNNGNANTGQGGSFGYTQPGTQVSASGSNGISLSASVSGTLTGSGSGAISGTIPLVQSSGLVYWHIKL